MHGCMLLKPPKWTISWGNLCFNTLLGILKHVQVSVTSVSHTNLHNLNHVYSKYSLTAQFLHFFTSLVLSMNDPHCNQWDYSLIKEKLVHLSRKKKNKQPVKWVWFLDFWRVSCRTWINHNSHHRCHCLSRSCNTPQVSFWRQSHSLNKNNR